MDYKPAEIVSPLDSSVLADRSSLDKDKADKDKTGSPDSSGHPTNNLKKVVILSLQTLFGLALLGYLIYQIGAKEIIDTILGTSPAIWLFLLLYILASVFITALCYKTLIDPTCGKIRIPEIFRYSLTTASLSRSFLGRYAEITLIYFLKRRGVEYGRGISIFLVDKMITLVIQLSISIVGFIFFFNLPYLLYASFVLLALTLACGWLIRSARIKDFLKKKILGRYQHKIRQFSATLNDLLHKHRLPLLLNMILTIARIVLTGTAVYAIFHYMGSEISLHIVIIINTILMTASLIPITTNGIGIRETLGVYLFGLFGINPIISVSTYLLFRIANYLFGIIILPVSLITYYKSRKVSCKQ